MIRHFWSRCVILCLSFGTNELLFLNSCNGSVGSNTVFPISPEGRRLNTTHIYGDGWCWDKYKSSRFTWLTMARSRILKKNSTIVKMSRRISGDDWRPWRRDWHWRNRYAWDSSMIFWSILCRRRWSWCMQIMVLREKRCRGKIE